MDLALVFSELFPIASERYSLEFVPEIVNEGTGEISGGLHEDGAGHLRATLRTIGWDLEGGQRSIRDIREQEVVVVWAEHRDDPRVPAYLAGWAAALRFIFERHHELAAAGALTGALRQRLEYAMPHDLVHPGVLALRRPQTADDFTDALLTNKKRLAGLVP